MYQYNYQYNMRDMLYNELRKSLMVIHRTLSDAIMTSSMKPLVDAVFEMGYAKAVADVISDIDPNDMYAKWLSDVIYSIARGIDQFVENIRLPRATAGTSV